MIPRLFTTRSAGLLGERGKPGGLKHGAFMDPEEQQSSKRALEDDNYGHRKRKAVVAVADHLTGRDLLNEDFAAVAGERCMQFVRANGMEDEVEFLLSIVDESSEFFEVALPAIIGFCEGVLEGHVEADLKSFFAYVVEAVSVRGCNDEGLVEDILQSIRTQETPVRSRSHANAPQYEGVVDI